MKSGSLSLALISATASACLLSTRAAENINITDVPDYAWYAGCFGTAGGNLMGFWDRHGFPDIYTGPTAGGVAPLTTSGANEGIRSMWASQAGFDGRPADKPGHADDYWEYLYELPDGEVIYSYESTAPDPYQIAGRAEHSPDSLCDFIGASQNKWADLNGECSGNIDAFAFNFWDASGDRRVNYTPPLQNGVPIRDVQSGLRQFTQYRGYDAQVTSQLADFNPNVPSGHGFTFEDLKAEINAGYPVMVMLQSPDQLSRSFPGMPRGNPEIHAMLITGYIETDDGQQLARYKTSWGEGDHVAAWTADIWEANMPVRGVFTFHPEPKITQIEPDSGALNLTWEGPASTVQDFINGTSSPAQWFVIEKAETVDGPFTSVSQPTTDLHGSVSNLSGKQAFFRVKILTAAEAGQSE
jgi:hypothetical protein